MVMTSDDDDNLTFLTRRATVATRASSPSPAMTDPTTTTTDLSSWQPTTPDGHTTGLQPIGALLPGWLERFNARSAVWIAREHAARTAFEQAGGVCWTCRDTGYVRAVPADEGGVPCVACATGQAITTRQRAALVDELLAMSGAPRRLAGLSFETFPASARKRASQVRRFADGWDARSGRGLLLLGEPSVGKTGLLVSALRCVLTRWVAGDETTTFVPGAGGSRRSVWFTTDVDLLHTLKRGFQDNTAQALIERAKTCTLLIIDDLGKADYKDGVGWGVEQLYHIIDARYSALRPTWFSTNLGLEQLTQRLGENGEAIMDRVADSCEAIAITGAKLRKVGPGVLA